MKNFNSFHIVGGIRAGLARDQRLKDQSHAEIVYLRKWEGQNIVDQVTDRIEKGHYFPGHRHHEQVVANEKGSIAEQVKSRILWNIAHHAAFPLWEYPYVWQDCDPNSPFSVY